MNIENYECVTQKNAHSRTSGKYSQITTTKPLEVLREMGWEVKDISVVNSKKHAGYQKHLIRLQNKNIARDSEGIPEIIFRNAHNGTSSFWLNLGYYKTACANGLMVGKTIQEHRIRHTGYTDEKVEVAINTLTENISQVLEYTENFRQVNLNFSEQMEYAKNVLEESKIEVIETEALIFPNRVADGSLHQKTLWQTYNTVQENLMKGNYRIPTVRKNSQSRKGLPIRNIDKNLNVNRILWDNAMEYL